MRLSRLLVGTVALLAAMSPGKFTQVVATTARAAADDADAVTELVKALADDSALIRKRAAVALGRLGAQAAPASAALRKALSDLDPDVREAAAAALRGIGGPVSKEELLHRLKDRSQPAASRTGACRELAERFASDPTVAATLESLLADPTVKLEAARALEAMEKRPRLTRLTRGVTLKGHSGPVAAIAFAPDGKMLVSVGGAPGEAGEVRIWDVAARREAASLQGHDSQVSAVAFSPDGTMLATSCGVPDRKAQRWVAGEVRLWDFPSGREKAVYQAHRRLITGLAFAAGGKLLATAGEDRVALLWDVASGREAPALTLAGHAGPLTAVAASPDGKLLATAGQDKTVRLWDAVSGEEKQAFRGHGGPVPCIAFSPDGRTLAAGGGVLEPETGRWTSGEAKLWDISTGKERLTIKRHTDVIAALAFAPDGQTLVTGGTDALIKLWDANSGEEKQAIPGHSGRVSAVAFSPDGKTLASAGDDRTVKLWTAIWEKPGR
jgi:dipeptidyl aminopeptidase/acylaminoacyl peptidase